MQIFFVKKYLNRYRDESGTAPNKFFGVLMAKAAMNVYTLIMRSLNTNLFVRKIFSGKS